MSNERAHSRLAHRCLGAIGLALIVLLGWAAEHVTRDERDPASVCRRWLALTAIVAITIAGRVADLLPLEFPLAGRGKRNHPTLAPSPRLR